MSSADSYIFVDHNGNTFRTGFQPTPAETKSLFAASALPAVPEAEWREIDRRKAFYDLNWYPDQRQCNGCTGFSSAMTASKARVLAGQPAVKLSGAYLYSLINGGRDQGSNIGDALQALKTNGACPEEICDIHKGYDCIYRKTTKQFDAEAARFKVEKSFTVDSVEQAVAVIQRGGVLEFAVKVGRNFGRIDSEGVSAFDAGTSNHAVHADGLRKTNSHGWCLDCQTWTASFGDKSRWLWPLEYIERTGGQEMWGVFALIDDPQDTHDPPPPV